MNRFHITLYTICLFVVSQFTFAQEQTLIRTDRDIYIAGEPLWFTVNCLQSKTNITSGLSKVIYVEILNEAAVPVTQIKCRADKGRMQSLIYLPDTISSGNYTLRANTKWMDNFSELNFAKKSITIINPFAKNAYLLFKSKSTYPRQLIANSNIKLNKLNYSAREKVSVTIPNKDVSELSELSISVVNSNLIDSGLPIPKNFKPNPEKERGLIALPELEGEIVSGTVANSETGELLVNETMILSFVTKKPVLKFSTTDSLGRFYFCTNHYGEGEMVIQPFPLDSTKLNYKIVLDESFSNQKADLIENAEPYSVEEVNRLNAAFVNMQVQALYEQYSDNMAIKDSIVQKESFYGKPEFRSAIDKYIALATTEEVIKEIVPFVNVRRRDAKPYFKINESPSLYPNEGDAMAFVDGVPINNTESILEINPSDIEYIDLVNLNYYMKNYSLGRLLCIYTRKGNMAGMDFDHRIFRQVHEGYINARLYKPVDYSGTKEINSSVADFRNTLFFSQINETVQGDDIKVSFYTSDAKGEYTVILSGIDAIGKLIEYKTTFTVE